MTTPVNVAIKHRTRLCYLPGVHELKDGCEVGEWHVLARSDQHSKKRQTSGWVGTQVINYLQNDDRMLGRILFQQVFEVRGAGAQNHLVGLGVLALMISLHALQHATGNKGYLGGNGDVAEALLISQVLERGDHVGLEVVPAEAELLVVSHYGQEVV